MQTIRSPGFAHKSVYIVDPQRPCHWWKSGVSWRWCSQQIVAANPTTTTKLWKINQKFLKFGMHRSVGRLVWVRRRRRCINEHRSRLQLEKVFASKLFLMVFWTTFCPNLPKRLNRFKVLPTYLSNTLKMELKNPPNLRGKWNFFFVRSRTSNQLKAFWPAVAHCNWFSI